jgi:Mg-chelatase subunit ChlD
MSDAYNESPIDNSSSDNNLINTELQVRLMNLVMGEASDFERDQLQLLMEQRPELAAFCKHLEHLHGLLREVGAGEPSIDVDSATADTEWRLPTDRRERVLAVLENRSLDLPPKVTLSNKRGFRNWRITTMEAIVVASVACVILGLMLPATQSAREAARQLSFSEAIRSRTVDLAPSTPPANRPVVRKTLNAVLSASEPVAPSTATTDLFTRPHSFARSEMSRGLGTDTGDAIGVSGQTLPSPYYLSDDVQYFPASPENKMASESPVSGKLDSLAVQKRGQKYGEKQLGESHFGRFGVDGRLAVDGEDQMARRGAEVVRSVEVDGASLPLGPTLFATSPNNSSALDKRYVQPPVPSVNFSEMDFQVRNSFGDTPPSVAVGQSGGVAGETTPAFTTDLDITFSAPDSVSLDASILPDASSSTFLAYGDSQNNIGGKEGKVAFESAMGNETASGQIVDKFAVQEGRRVGGEQQLAERNFGGLAGKSENGMGRRGSTSAGVAADDFDGISSGFGLGFERGVENLPTSGEFGKKPGSASHWALEKTDAKKLSDRSADPADQTSFWGDKQKTDRYYSDFKSPKSDVAGWEEGVAEANRKPVEATESEMSFSVAEAEPSNRSVIINGAIIPGIRLRDHSKEGSKLDSTKSEKVTQGWLNRLFDNDVSNTSTLMMTATPRIIIPEEEETLGSSAPSSELSSRDRVELKKDAKPSGSKRPLTIDEQSAAADAFSTFSLHVSDVSFKLAQAALSQSQWPEPAKIRIEEFVNAMDYHDPLPSGDQKIACRVEQAIHPFLMQRNLLRVSMRTAAAGRSQNTPLRLTLLLDNSGSMERPDRRQAVLRAFQTLAQQLKATDQITLISFASSPRLLADKVPGNQGETLLKLIEELPSEGGTNIESALQLAREKASEQQVAGAQNRIILLTDGAVNLGDANPENLAKQVTQMRDAGIAFDAAGISAQELNDEVLEALTRHGDGRYYLLGSAESASESFAAQIAGSLRPSAQNVKVQVEFNPQRVGRYKLLGYEKHRLNKEDFRDDKVDAAELAAAEAGVAVYQYEIKPKGSGDVGSVSVRFRDLATGQMIERRWPVLYESNTPRLEQSQPSLQLAAAAALFAAKLGGGPLADSVDMAQLQKIVAKLPEQFASQPRVQQLRTMIDQAIAIQ